MSEKKVILNPDLKAIDDAQTADSKYLIKMEVDKDGKRILVFDTLPIYTKHQTKNQKIADLAELASFNHRRVEALEIIVKDLLNRTVSLETKP